MSGRCLFITGTDTGVGKTHVAATLMRALAARGFAVAGVKPVASGAVWRDGDWHNEDVAALTAAANVALPREIVNPYCFEPPVAPHLAAREAGVAIETQRLLSAVATAREQADWVIVEGVGGLRVPLNAELDVLGLAQRCACPVILVVGLRLGCINHARLSEAVILAAGVPYAGWLGNHVEAGLARAGGNRETLLQYLEGPHLGWLPHDGAGATVQSGGGWGIETVLDNILDNYNNIK